MERKFIKSLLISVRYGNTNQGGNTAADVICTDEEINDENRANDHAIMDLFKAILRLTLHPSMYQQHLATFRFLVIVSFEG
jgi:hypothetical protein